MGYSAYWNQHSARTFESLRSHVGLFPDHIFQRIIENLDALKATHIRSIYNFVNASFAVQNQQWDRLRPLLAERMEEHKKLAQRRLNMFDDDEQTVTYTAGQQQQLQQPNPLAPGMPPFTNAPPPTNPPISQFSPGIPVTIPTTTPAPTTQYNYGASVHYPYHPISEDNRSTSSVHYPYNPPITVSAAPLGGEYLPRVSAFQPEQTMGRDGNLRFTNPVDENANYQADPMVIGSASNSRPGSAGQTRNSRSSIRSSRTSNRSYDPNTDVDEVVSIKGEIEGTINNVKADLNNNISNLKTEVANNMTNLETKITSKLDAQLEVMSSIMQQIIATNKRQIEDTENPITKSPRIVPTTEQSAGSSVPVELPGSRKTRATRSGTPGKNNKGKGKAATDATSEEDITPLGSAENPIAVSDSPIDGNWVSDVQIKKENE